MHYSNSFKTMLQSIYSQTKIARILLDYQDRMCTDELDYITMRKNMISYLPFGREHQVNEDGRWVRDGRQESKPGRVVRKMIPNYIWNDFEVKDADVEIFTNQCAAYVGCNGDGDSSDDKIELIVCNGELIKHYYDYENYSPNASGNLAGSCMRSVNSDFFNLYSCNPDSCSLIVAIDNMRRVLGRALVWQSSNGTRYMDTVYASDSVRPMFINFAISKGMRYKAQQSCHHPVFDMFNGNKFITDNGNVSIVLRRGGHEYYPYMDTLQYLQGNVLSNVPPDDGDYLTLRSVDGGYEECEQNEGVYDEWNQQYIDEDDAVYLDYYRPNGRWFAGYVHVDSTTYVVDLADRVIDNDAIYVPHNSSYYLEGSDEIVFDEYESEYIPMEDAVELFDGLYALQNNCVQMYNGEWCHCDDAVKLDDDGNYAHISMTLYHAEEDIYYLKGATSEYLVPSNI